MGGHGLSRIDPAYAQVARLAKALSEQKFLVATGGGPGAMEAAHLGAALAGRPSGDIDSVIKALTPTTLPNLTKIVSADGTIDAPSGQRAHEWLKPAIEQAEAIGTLGESLGVPTWVYGHEPSTPFASHHAKYFQNSIREDGLLAIARHGIVFAAGGPGTMQEIFQDAAQNHYRSLGWFSPMVFFGKKYWEQDFPVRAVMDKLIKPADQNLLCYTDDINEAVKFLLAFKPPPSAPAMAAFSASQDGVGVR